MKRYAWLIPGLALVSFLGCGDKDDDTGGNGAGGDAGAADGGSADCGVGVDSTWPASGETDAYYRTQIEFKLSAEDESGPTVALSDSSGGDVAGSQAISDDGKTVYFYPSAPLASGASYTATLTYCTGEASFDFTTGSLGADLTADLVGNAYLVDLEGARFVEPEGVASLLLGELNNSILLGVEATTPKLQMIGAISEEGNTNQDLCEESIDFPEADFDESPYFAIGPQTTTISAAGYDIQIDNLEVSGTFSADGSYFGGGVLGGQLDARVLAPLVEELVGSSDPAEICALLVGFGVECTECISDGQPYCIGVRVEDLTATSLGTSLVVRTASDIAGDAACAR